MPRRFWWMVMLLVILFGCIIASLGMAIITQPSEPTATRVVPTKAPFDFEALLDATVRPELRMTIDAMNTQAVEHPENFTWVCGPSGEARVTMTAEARLGTPVATTESCSD